MGHLELHFGEGRSLESSVLGSVVQVCTMGGVVSALEHSLLSQKHKPSAWRDFVIAGHSLRLGICRKVCTYSFQCRGQNSPPLLEPSCCFDPGTPSLQDMWVEGLPRQSGCSQPAARAYQHLCWEPEVLPQQRLSICALLQISCCHVILLELLLEISGI